LGPVVPATFTVTVEVDIRFGRRRHRRSAFVGQPFAAPSSSSSAMSSVAGCLAEHSFHCRKWLGDGRLADSDTGANGRAQVLITAGNVPVGGYRRPFRSTPVLFNLTVRARDRTSPLSFMNGANVRPA
jgi:hypothetical protein